MRNLVLILLCACGAAEVPDPVPEKLAGTYAGTMTFEQPCDYLPPFILLDVTFSPEGQLETPVWGMGCTATYPLELECLGPAVTLHASGAVVGHNAHASGILTGVPTCPPMAFSLDLRAK